MSEHKIQTSPIFPPIPIRGLDWCAHFGNYEPGQPIGHGSTDAEAIEDLKAQKQSIFIKILMDPGLRESSTTCAEAMAWLRNQGEYQS